MSEGPRPHAAQQWLGNKVVKWRSGRQGKQVTNATKMRGGDATSADVVPGYRGYGLPVALKLFHYFVGMIKSGKNSAHSRVLGLRMVNHVLESAHSETCTYNPTTYLF